MSWLEQNATPGVNDAKVADRSRFRWRRQGGVVWIRTAQKFRAFASAPAFRALLRNYRDFAPMPAHVHRTFFQDWTNSCRRGSPLAKPSNLPCAPQAHVASSRRWRHRVRLDEAVISSAEGARFSGLCEPLSPSGHLRTRVAPPPSRRCQSLTTGARGRWSSRLVPVSSSSLATVKEGLQGAPPARIFARKMSLLSAAQIFLPLRGADRWRLAA